MALARSSCRPGGRMPRSSPITRQRCSAEQRARMDSRASGDTRHRHPVRLQIERNEEKAAQRRRMVDADRPGVAHCRLDHPLEGRMPARGDRRRLQGGQPPVLALGREGIGRAADRSGRDVMVALAPGGRTVQGLPDRKVEIETDAQARRLGAVDGWVSCSWATHCSHMWKRCRSPCSLAKAATSSVSGSW